MTMDVMVDAVVMAPPSPDETALLATARLIGHKYILHCNGRAEEPTGHCSQCKDLTKEIADAMLDAEIAGLSSSIAALRDPEIRDAILVGPAPNMIELCEAVKALPAKSGEGVGG
jgi:predicted dienelactone hydrolase